MSTPDKDRRVGDLEARVRELEARLAARGEPAQGDILLRSIAGLELKIVQLNVDNEVEYVNSAMAQAFRHDPA